MTELVEPVRLVLVRQRAYHLSVFNVGLACCAVELDAALEGTSGGGLAALTPESVHVMVISGTVTNRLAPLIRRQYEAAPRPLYVCAFGACASTGGPYWDSYAVTQGAGKVLPVDVYVPGCPPRPEALWYALERVEELITGRASGVRADG